MNFNGILNSRQAGIKKATLIMVVSVLISRVLGLLRDRFLAGFFGASIDLDIYFTAFRIPDFIYSIIFAGGITVSFLPIFSEYFRKDKKEAWKIVNYVLNLFFVLYFLVFFVFVAFTPQLVSYLAPGFDALAQAKTVELTRLVFLSVFFFGLSSILTVILNYFNLFLAYSLAPILYNLGIIFGIVFLSPHLGIFGAGLGVVLGSFLHFLVQLPGARNSGFSYRAVFSLSHKAVKDFFYMIGPRIISSSSVQFSFVIITLIASGIGEGAISIFNLSNNLRYLPIGVIGIPFATAAFPALSKLWAGREKEEYLKRFKMVFSSVLYFSFPVGVLIFLLKDQIVRIILQTGAFSGSAVEITAACLGLYFLSTSAQCLVPIVLRGFFSLKDSVTPTVISLFFMLVNAFLCFFFVNLSSSANVFSQVIGNVFGFTALADVKILSLVLAFNLSLLLEFFFLVFSFYRKIGDFGLKQVLVSFLKILVSTAAMASVLMVFLNYWPLSLSLVWQLIWFVFACLAAGAVYLLSTRLLKTEESEFLNKFFFKRNED
jgi:putative peptidoglycan lipid II flippase